MQEAIRNLLDFGATFVNVNTKDRWGMSPLGQVCIGGFWGADSIATLLQRNADVTERDLVGRTCLHLCLSSPWQGGWYNFGPSSWIQQYSMGIVLLLKHGADIYAEDYYGRSVSDTAYSQSEERVGLGRVKGDVWDFVLASSGYSISPFRQGHGRRACYDTAIWTTRTR